MEGKGWSLTPTFLPSSLCRFCPCHLEYNSPGNLDPPKRLNRADLPKARSVCFMYIYIFKTIDALPNAKRISIATNIYGKSYG